MAVGVQVIRLRCGGTFAKARKAACACPVVGLHGRELVYLPLAQPRKCEVVLEACQLDLACQFCLQGIVDSAFVFAAVVVQVKCFVAAEAVVIAFCITAVCVAQTVVRFQTLRANLGGPHPAVV